jgi:hypothetical protein
VEKPAKSTIHKICYGQKFKTAATFYGCQHESEAKAQYIDLKKDHQIEVCPSGLVLNPDYPEFGASPDALVIFTKFTRNFFL